MIIQLRGTSGSGKTWAMQQVTKLFDELMEPVFMEKRKRPILYLSKLNDAPVAVLGSYETACGGCDTIQEVAFVFALAESLHVRGFHVLFEGLLLSADVQRVLTLNKLAAGRVAIVTLSTTIEQCLEQVNARRKARLGDEFTPVKEDNTRAKARGVELSHAKLELNGVMAFKCSSKEAVAQVRALLLRG